MKFGKKHIIGIVTILAFFVLFSLVPTAIQEELDESVRTSLEQVGVEERSQQNWAIILIGFALAIGLGIGIMKFFR